MKYLRRPQEVKPAFTLIELLVVIAIIGVLSSVVLASINDARQKSRDTKRLSEIQQLQTAIESYHTANGQYPTACGGLTNTWRGHGSNFGNCNTDYISGISALIAVLPVDPLGDTTNGYLYKVSTDRQQYKIMSYSKVEQGIVLKGLPNARCSASCADAYCDQNTYALYTPGGSCW